MPPALIAWRSEQMHSTSSAARADHSLPSFGQHFHVQAWGSRVPCAVLDSGWTARHDPTSQLANSFAGVVLGAPEHPQTLNPEP